MVWVENPESGPNRKLLRLLEGYITAFMDLHMKRHQHTQENIKFTFFNVTVHKKSLIVIKLYMLM